MSGFLNENEQRLYDSIIESVVLETVHGLAKDKRRLCGKCGTACHLAQALPNPVSTSDRYVCPSCSKTFVSTRFAQHLEKCMGLASAKPRKKKDSDSPKKKQST